MVTSDGGGECTVCFCFACGRFKSCMGLESIQQFCSGFCVSFSFVSRSWLLLRVYYIYSATVVILCFFETRFVIHFLHPQSWHHFYALLLAAVRDELIMSLSRR